MPSLMFALSVVAGLFCWACWECGGEACQRLKILDVAVPILHEYKKRLQALMVSFRIIGFLFFLGAIFAARAI